MKLLDPISLAKLSSLKLKVRYVVEGMLSGLHSSPLKGQSLEFAQHREYTAGDELKYIDWKVFSRTDKFFVKQFQDETNLRAYILLDSSGSMAYKHGKNVTKLEYSTYLAAALAFLLLRQEDAVSLSTFDTKLNDFMPPSHSFSYLHSIFNKLENLKAGGETNIDVVLKSFGQYIKKRGLIILISDLFSDPVNVIQALKYFRFRHHQVMVIHVLDKQEIDFNFSGENTYVGLEDNLNIFANAEVIKTKYKSIVNQFIDEYKIGFRKSGIAYNLVTTDIPIELALAKCLT